MRFRPIRPPCVPHLRSPPINRSGARQPLPRPRPAPAPLPPDRPRARFPRQQLRVAPSVPVAPLRGCCAARACVCVRVCVCCVACVGEGSTPLSDGFDGEESLCVLRCVACVGGRGFDATQHRPSRSRFTPTPVAFSSWMCSGFRTRSSSTSFGPFQSNLGRTFRRLEHDLEDRGSKILEVRRSKWRKLSRLATRPRDLYRIDGRFEDDLCVKCASSN